MQTHEASSERTRRSLHVSDVVVGLVLVGVVLTIGATSLRPMLHNAAATAAEMDGDVDSAEHHLRRAVALGRRFGSHDSVATALERLVGLYGSTGRSAEAETALIELLALRTEHFGPEHPGTAEVMEDLGIAAKQQGRHEDAEGWFRESLSVRETAFGARDPQTASAMLQLGSLYRSSGDLRRADLYLQRARTILEDRVAARPERELFAPVPGRPSPEATGRILLAATLYELSAVRTLENRLVEAHALAERVLAYARAGNLSPALEVAALSHRGALEQAQGNQAAAAVSYADARRVIRDSALEGTSLEKTLDRNIALSDSSARDARALSGQMREHLARNGALAISVSWTAALTDRQRRAR